MKCFVLTAFLVIFAFVIGWAREVPPGYDAASFARIGVGVRALGMGGAFTAVAQEPTAIYWNPAGLAGFSELAAEGMYTNWLGAGIHYQYLAAAGYPPLGEGRVQLRLGEVPVVFGAGWILVMIPGIPYVDEQGNTGTFSAWSNVFLASLAFPVPRVPGLSFGATFRLYHDRILEGISFGVGVDAGFLWQGKIAGLPVSVGFATTDLADTKIRWYGTPGEPVNYVPWVGRAGAAVELWEGRVLLAASYEWGWRRPRFERLRLGAELSLGWFSLRFGYNWLVIEPKGWWSLGLGARPTQWLTLDYAFLPSGLGESHLIAMSVRF